MPTFPFASTITLHRKTYGTKDQYGNPAVTTTDIVVPGCAVWPRVSSESVQGQDLVITGITVFAPDGTVVLPTDTVTVNALVYDVVADPGVWGPNPWTGTRAGVEVQLTKATG